MYLDTKSFLKMGILVISLFFVLLFTGGVYAAENTTHIETDYVIESNSNNEFNSIDSTNIDQEYSYIINSSFQSNKDSNTSFELLDDLSGCCSVLLHVRDGYDVFSYRRDSSYAADLYFEDSYWYGKEIVKEYKTTNGYFFHTIVASDGWIASMGGPDITSVVNQLEALAGATWDGGRITWDTLNMAYGLVSSMGMGHFLIKAPNNQVGYVIVNSGSRMDLFTMSDGQYIEVPNGPGYFRSGFASTADPVEYAIYRAMTNPWGVNHRNIITYQVIRDSDIYNYLTYVNIYASRTISSDKIVIGGHVIHGSYLPAATGYMLIGQSVLKIPIPTTTFGYQNMIYTYSKILNAYKNTGSLPGSVVVGPWMVNVKHVADAAVHVKNYIDTNHQLPSVATVNGIVVTLPTFLSLLTASVLQINISDFNTLMNPQNFGNPSQPREQMTNGEMQRSEYIAIAQNVKNFMNNQLKAPEFAYNTSLGLYFGYQNMIYTYSKIMAIYNSTGTLPSSIKVSSWRFLCDPNAATFSVNNVLNAATWTKEYIETNYQLPLVVTVNDGMDIMGNTVSRDIDMSSFLGLLINSLIQLNSGQTTVDYMTFGTAPNPRDSVHLGNMPKNEYISIARNVKNFMDVQGKAPEYAYSTSLGLYFGYQNMIYTYSKILDTYKTDGYLPAIVQIKSWSTLIDPNIARLRPLQIVNAATEVKNFVESNFQLPSMVNISGQSITMPTFLGLLTGCVLQINSNDLVSEIDSIIYGYAPVPRDSMSAGNLPKSEYLGIALNVKNFMDVQGKAPEYAYSTSLGLYFGYENMIYTFSKVLDAYNCSGFLPGSVSVKPWRVLSDSNIATFSLLEIVSAAVVVKNYVDVNFQLPLHVTINGHNIIMPTFLELLTTAVLQLNKTDLVTPINSKTYGPAPVPRDSMSAGNLPKSEYLGIARNVKNFMDVQGKAPEYAYSTSLGLYFGYENMIYTFSKVLDAYNCSGFLPGSVSVKPWRVLSDSNIATFSPLGIVSAAVVVKNYVDVNFQLPLHVTINGHNIIMPTFLELLTTAVLQLNKTDLVTPINSKTYGTPPNPRNSVMWGYMDKSEYLGIARNVKNFMDVQGKAPEYAYSTSLGLYFGYQNMIYTFSKVLDSYNSIGCLPTSIQVKPWNIITNPSVITFTPQEIVNAASEVKKFIETYNQLPVIVNIKGHKIIMPTFLELITTTVLQINNNDLISGIDSLSFSTAPNPRDTIIQGYMPKSEYLGIARNVKNFMDVQGKAPEYAYSTSLGLYFGYENMIYTFSKVLDAYNTTKTLNTVSLTAWKIISNPSIGTFTSLEIVNAATEVKYYIENNHQLPANVNIKGKTVFMADFLEYLTTVVLQINNNDFISGVDSVSFSTAPYPRDSMNTGNMLKSEYLGIARNVKNFMDVQGKAPEYAYSTSLGLYFGYENMIYTFSKVLDAYNSTGSLPTSVQIKAWNIITDPYAATFTPLQIVNAAKEVKNYIENNKQLPTIVNIYGHNIIMPTFLELLTTTVLQINKNDLITPINSKSYGNAPLPRDTMNTGNIPKNEYISIAQNVKNFMDSQLKAPEYAYSTSIGLYFSYQNMIYTYSKILDAYNSTGSLPSNVAVGPWMVTVSQVVEAAVQVKTYIDTNHQLPSSITINGFVVSMPTFLKLLTTSVIQIKNKDLNTLINPLNYGVPFSPRDSMIKGDMLKTEYIFIAQNVNKFMEDNGKAPEYAYDTSLGLYFGYQNMIYTFSQILNTYSTSRELPNNVSINPWMVSVGQVVNAAVQVKTYIDTYRELPSSATVNGIMMSMPTFLQLLTTSVIQINKNDVTTLLNYQSYGYPSQPRDQLKNRDMYKVEYISIAQNVKNFMDSQMKAPEYAIARL